MYESNMWCTNRDFAVLSLIFANFLLLVSGVGLVGFGVFLLDDTERVLISRLVLTPLPQPLLYYVSLVMMSVGLILTALSVLGCWATHLYNYCLLAFYLFILVLLLVGECVVIVLVILCPQYLGINLEREDIQDSWQRNYGVPGREQYTAAIDLVQTKLQCCGINNGNDYSISWWRLRELAPPSLLVPLSCCIQEEPVAFLDPRPMNASLCEDSKLDNYRLARHLEGCLEQINSWLMEQIKVGFLGSMCVLAMELLLLLLTILVCIKQNHKNQKPLPPQIHDNKYPSFPYSGS